MPADEPIFDVRDARSSARMLALLVGCAAVVNLLCGLGHALPWTLRATRIVELVAAAAALIALGATRRRPGRGLALACCGVLIALYFVLLPVQAVAWREAGRPWEAMGDLHFATMVLALAVPGSFALGAALLGGFAVMGLAIHFWLRGVGTSPNELIAGEPTLTLVFVVIGFAVLWVRRRRRALALRFVRRSADVLTLTRLSACLGEIAGELGSATRALGEALAPLRAGTDAAVVERIDRALGRIGDVRNGLDRSVTFGREARPLDQEERAFYARDAHQAAMTLTLAIVVVETLAIFGTRDLAVGMMRRFFLFSGGLAALSAAALFVMRKQPSERFAFALFLVNILPAFAQYWYSTPAWAGAGGAFDPLAGNKTFLVLVPLIVPRRWWVAIGIEGAMTAMSVALYHHHGFAAMRDRSPLAEPWATALYLLVGLGLVATRENRRLMSVRLLRADREAAALLSSAEVSLTLLDQLGSPLQVLASSLAQLRLAGTDEPALEPLQAALVRLVAAARRVPPADAKTLAQLGVSL